MKQDKALQAYRAQFDEFERGLNGASASPLHRFRRAAMQRLAERGFPTQRDEEWRYTNLNPLFDTAFTPAPAPGESALEGIDLGAYAAGLDDAILMTFVDGHCIPALSKLEDVPAGMTVGSLADILGEGKQDILDRFVSVGDTDDHPFAALNAAFTQGGAYVHAAKGTVCAKPIHLLFLSTSAVPAITQPRILLVAEEHSQFSVLEQHAAISGGMYFSNTVAESLVGEGAHVRHYKIQDESEDAFHVAGSYARVARGASYANHYFGFGARLVRNHIHAELEGEGAESTMNGLFMPTGSQHMDHHTVVDHAKPHCNSHELYKGILLDESRGVFSGKIIVRPDAQKTDAKQTNNNLLLSDKALVDSKPQLEIWADDVKCTHGATIGRLDEDALFYLRTRGLGLERAKNLLSYAFASEIVSHVADDALREHLDTVIHRRLERSWK